MRILAIDPGSTESAYVEYDTSDGQLWRFGKAPNEDVLDRITVIGPDRFAIEMVASYGMAVGREVFETCVWIGRFLQASGPWVGGEDIVYRMDVKMHLCHHSRATDSNIRQALIDRYGGKEKAIGRKATPGPLYGVSKDVWSALGVAVTAAEK